MNDNVKTHEEESWDTSLRALSIADLRKYSKLMGISAQRDWIADDFITAIKAQHAAAAYTSSSSSSGSTLSPGYARVLIHKDPTPGASNSMVPLMLNARTFLVPRGVEVPIPLEYVGVLADAKYTTTRQKREPSVDMPQGIVVEETIQSYPFQVLEVRPHEGGSKFTSNYDARAAMCARRIKFRDTLGHWPTHGELVEWENKQKG